MKNAIVTGATGFIGTKMVQRLEREGIKVFAVSRSTFESQSSLVIPVVCEMKDMDTLPMLIGEDVDVFYHFAWDGSSGVARKDVTRQIENITNTCKAALSSKALNCKRLVVSGTVSENFAANVIDYEYRSNNIFYAIAKDTTHKYLDVLCNNNEIPYSWVQLTNVFGNDWRGENLFSYTFNEIMRGNVPSFGPCDEIFDFVYVEDVINAFWAIGNADECRNFYVVSSGCPRLLRDYIITIAKKTGGTVDIGKRKSEGLIFDPKWFDSKQTREELQLGSGTVFEDAIDIILEERNKCKRE